MGLETRNEQEPSPGTVSRVDPEAIDRIFHAPRSTRVGPVYRVGEHVDCVSIITGTENLHWIRDQPGLCQNGKTTREEFRRTKIGCIRGT